MILKLLPSMEGPIVLAGLCEEDRVLYGDAGHPETILIPDDERKWSSWNISYRTQNQDRNIRFIPLYDVGYEKYSVYFKVKNREAKGFPGKILSKKGTSEFTLQKDPRNRRMAVAVQAAAILPYYEL